MRYTICFIALFLVLVSCSTPFELEVSKEPPRIVVNSQVRPDSIWKFHISSSWYILDKRFRGDQINNADIKIFEGNNLIGQALHDQRKMYYLESPYPEAGKTYQIVIEAPGFEVARAQTTIPFKPQFIRLKIDSNKVKRESGSFYPVTITFKDPADQEDFYNLRFYLWQNTIREFITTNQDSITKDTLDTVISNFESDDFLFNDLDIGPMGIRSGMYFKDQLIAGKKYPLKIYIPSNLGSDPGDDPAITYSRTILIVEFRRITKEYFLHHRSVRLQSENSGNPLAVEPVQIYSNVVNGYGLFAGFNAVRDSIVYEWP